MLTWTQRDRGYKQMIHSCCRCRSHKVSLLWQHYHSNVLHCRLHILSVQIDLGSSHLNRVEVIPVLELDRRILCRTWCSSSSQQVHIHQHCKSQELWNYWHTCKNERRKTLNYRTWKWAKIQKFLYCTLIFTHLNNNNNNKTGTASVLMPQYDDWYEKIFSTSGLLLPWVIVLAGRIFSLAFRASDSTGVMLIGFVTKMIIECLECCTYHFRQVDNWYVAEVRHIAEWTSKFESECFRKNRYHKKNYIDLEEFCHKTSPASRCWICAQQKNTSHVPEKPIIQLKCTFLTEKKKRKRKTACRYFKTQRPRGHE